MMMLIKELIEFDKRIISQGTIYNITLTELKMDSGFNKIFSEYLKQSK